MTGRFVSTQILRFELFQKQERVDDAGESRAGVLLRLNREGRERGSYTYSGPDLFSPALRYR